MFDNRMKEESNQTVSKQLIDISLVLSLKACLDERQTGAIYVSIGQRPMK